MSCGDLIIADKGFLIQDILPSGVSLNIPPFLHNQFTPSEVLRTEEIGSARVHVERVNARIKNFRILNFIPHHLRIHLPILVRVIATLVNFQCSLIDGKKLFNMSN